MESGDEGDQSDCEIKGGYDPAVRRILARAEKRGDKTWRKEDSGDDSSDESENGDSDEDPESEGFSSREFFPATSSTRMEEDRQRAVKEVERSIEQCLSYLDKSTGFESRKALEDQLEGLQMQKKKLKKEGSKKFDMKYVLRSRKGKKPEKMCPVVIRGQSLVYKPWQNTDMSDILEKLPTLQDGAYPWISKLEEIMVGTQPAIGDIKRLLANLLGVPAMEEILQKAGLKRYVGTAVNDPELFSVIRGRMWRTLRNTFPTNVHPDDIFIEPLGEEENPRAQSLIRSRPGEEEEEDGSMRIFKGFQKYATTVDSLAISPGSVTDLEKTLEEILEGVSEEDVTLVRCVTVNPAENLPTLEDGEPHDCVQEAEKHSRSMLPLMLILCLVGSAGGSPIDNVFWQYANWTAKQYTNDSCYVCHLMPSSVDKHSITTAPQDLSATLQAVAHTCLSPDCLKVIHYEYPHINYSLSLSQDFCSKTRNTTDLAICLQALQYFLTNRSPAGTPLAISAINKGPFSVCFEGFGHTLLGHLPDSLCPYTVTPCNGSSSSNCSALAPDDKGTTPSSYVTDWYWVCSYKVYVTLPENWGGRCAFTLFNSSLILISHNPLGGAHIARRNKRSSDDDFPPPEHQLKSKAAKFWECLFPQYGLTQVWNQLEVTHYRLATFTNATRMALQGVKDELTALRLTTMQNRMALDLLLAEEGGVCAMVGDSCCTYIPANDEDHGSIAVALDRMRQVSTQLQLDEHGDLTRKSSVNPKSSTREVCDLILGHTRGRFSFTDHLVSATLLQGNRFEQYNTAFPEEALSNTIKAYPVLRQGELKTEVSLIYSKEEFKACCGAVGLFQLFMQNNLEEVFPETVTLLKILIITPMSTAEAERCFSTLKRTDFSEKLSDPGQAECIGHVSGEKISHRDDRLYQECH
ncbi:hypothetical protein MHYP_G00364300 [Metynnis hypsauchen]